MGVEDIEKRDGEKLEISLLEGPLTGGVLAPKSGCCGVPVVQSRGAHDIGNGMYVGGVIVNECSRCHRPYHPNLIGGSLS